VHPMGVVALGQCQVGHVGVEAATAVGTEMLGVGDHEVNRPARADIAQIVKGSPGRIAAWRRPTAPRTLAATVVAASQFAMRGRQILDPGDPLGDVGYIVAWPFHNPAPPDEHLVRRAVLHQIERIFLLLCCYSLLFLW
jgi:hypothetical protein